MAHQNQRHLVSGGHGWTRGENLDRDCVHISNACGVGMGMVMGYPKTVKSMYDGRASLL
jgi:hypothetical protein